MAKVIINENVEIGNSGIKLNDLLGYKSEYVKLYEGSAIKIGTGTTITLNDNVENYKFLHIVVRNSSNFNDVWVIPDYFYSANINMGHALFNGDGNINLLTINPMSIKANKLVMNNHINYLDVYFVTCYGFK